MHQIVAPRQSGGEQHNYSKKNAGWPCQGAVYVFLVVYGLDHCLMGQVEANKHQDEMTGNPIHFVMQLWFVDKGRDLCYKTL